jgi:CO/xanthine dehydrogenase Mo-binding subunit
MSKVPGRGMAAVNYPTGMNLGGDPTIALIHASTSGVFNISISSVELGQGLKTVLAQIGAEALDVPFESVVLHNDDTDTGPYCTGTFASRTTHRAGNAIIAAAQELREVMFEEAAELLDAAPGDLVTDGKGNIHVRGASGRSVTVAEVCSAAHFVHGRAIAGRGIFFKAKSPVDPDTGAMDPDSTESHACTIADVEVDTETGQVSVLRLASAYEIGRALNPRLVRGQIVGGAWMGVSHTLYETTAPYYPLVEHAPTNFSEYLMPGAAECPVIEAEVLGIASSNGPYGQKGVGEMTANSPIPAIVNAIYNAIGIRFYELPITPEKVLRALEEKRAAAAAPEVV